MPESDGASADVGAAAQPASAAESPAEPSAEPSVVSPVAATEGVLTEEKPAADGVAGRGAGRARESRWGLPARVVAAVVGGVALFAAFPPLSWWLCAPLGIGLLVASIHGTRPRRAAWIGYLAAVAFLLPALAWVRSIGDDVWFMLVGVESLFYAAMAALAALVFRLPAWPLWFGGLWVLMEWGRSLVPIGGFPWARAAFSQGESLFTPYAALGGVPLVSFAVALCGALLAQAVLGRRRTTAGQAAAPARESAGRVAPSGRGAVLARHGAPLALALAVPLLGLAVPRPGDEGRTVNVGIVQGNVPGEGMYALGDEPAVVLRNHANETKRLAQAVREGKLPKPDLVILPENSTDIDPYRDEYARQIIHDSVRDVGVPTLVGAVVAIGDEHRATRSLVWDPVTGPGAYYDKQHLVPFGEYTPFKDLVLALWERANLVGRQSIPGDKPGDLKMGPVTIGAVNCYEVAYDDTVRETVRAGGTPLVVQTNNASYALSNLPPQQLAMSQLRAVEHNRAVVTAATTGISAYVTPDGKVSWQTRERVADMNVVAVPVRTEETLATRVGALPEWALMSMGAAAAVAAAWLGRRRGGRMGDRMRNDG
ncbi:apolipoprotein N-acyltransferase [Nonomuraea gerenzanensis]|uniref:Apolipoprotein N-acyltransferase n=1 Tax=Nonomuraea gerenzanensis TaxID=93944 RepID=A0A1M4E9E6_9ACTN|nr:apolipoprotein N-acyltransferase [Nonomuraea gerenzanensis]UBU17776.1 apolipoprotein N-acyltransferase [Nonomuraea gerenzanensis]SBO95557.1 Apolipoprotein N-acyltransferase in lipid-linked oligosaccharide synthesis cluster [Nonomuraea gerenzanensis]